MTKKKGAVVKEKIPVLTEFVIGKTSLLSNSTCDLKITVDGQERMIALPIKSLGILEVQEAVRKTLPEPPTETIVIKKDTRLGKELGLTEDSPVKVFDITDKKYQKKVQDYHKELQWQTCLASLDMKFVDQEGNEITDNHQRKTALVNSGITGHHLDAITAAVGLLTTERETLADFLFDSTSD